MFAGVGFIALPVDLLKSYLHRPRETITKSEFIRQATEMGKRAKVLVSSLTAVHKEQKANGVNRKTKAKVKELTAELLALEEEEYQLREKYPQGDDPGLAWAMTVIGYFLSLVFGVVSVALTGCWLIHLVVYCFMSPPLSPMLNQMFIDLDSVFGLFGTLFFAIFCFYLVCCTIKGNLKLGLNLLIFTVRCGLLLPSLHSSEVPVCCAVLTPEPDGGAEGRMNCCAEMGGCLWVCASCRCTPCSRATRSCRRSCSTRV